MPVHRFSPAPRAGFTLIELLVVIAIIALLIAILLPTLAGARRQGRVATTLSRLRNLGMNTTIYADAHRGNMPVLLDRDEKAFLGLSVLARAPGPGPGVPQSQRPHGHPGRQASDRQRPILADLAGVEITAAISIAPINLNELNWHCSFSYDNDAKRTDDGRNRVFLGDRANYIGGETYSRNWGDRGQCVVWTDQHAAFVKSKSLRDQSDPNMYHHNEYLVENWTEVVDGVSVTRATLDTHLRFFSEQEDDLLLPN